MKALAFAFLLFAIAPIDIDTTKIENGARQSYAAGPGRMVSVAKDAGVTTVVVVEGERVDTLVVRNVDGKTVIAHTDNGLPRPAPSAQRAPVIIDGMDVEPFLEGDPVDRSLRQQSLGTYYICPRDRAVLRVPNGPAEAMFKCPVDGTLMRPGVGPSQQYFLLN